MTTTPNLTGIRITTDKQVERVNCAGLAAKQEIVGGLIEAVELSDGSTMYVNEEGRILGLPFNSIASDVCGLGGRGDLMLSGICGDVVIVGPLDAEGDDTDVTDLAASWVDRVAREA